MSITAKECEALARDTLSEERFHHTLCVRDQAVALARRFGADPEKAEIAALLHDITKEEGREKQLQWLVQGGIIKKPAEADKIPDKVWHSYTGAVYARYSLGVDDREILNAMFYHTTGRGAMTLLDKTLYLADKTSAERDYPGVESLRALLDRGFLNEALLQSMQAGADKVRRKNGIPQKDTLEALETLEREQGACMERRNECLK